MCTSTDDCFCHEQVRQSRSPNSSYAQRRTSSAGMVSTSGSCRLGVAKQHLLQRVGRAARGGASRAGSLPRAGCCRGSRRARTASRTRPGSPWSAPRRAGRRGRPRGRSRRRGRCASRRSGGRCPAVPPSRPSVITFQAPASSSSLIHSTHWYGAKTASASFEPTSERTVKSRAKSAISSSLRSRGRSIDAVGDLDVRHAELAEPALVLVELALRVDGLEEGAADHDRLVLQHVELALQVRRHVGRAPAELDDVDVVAARLEHVLPRARAEALVDHVREAAVAASASQRTQSRA